ncbi:putative tail-fiber protein [Acinetobacter phage LZ35]|uniref:Tail fiber protein n=1 Tax=Acinetobacter phage LZ35 TaxID=1792222 RepID=A0A190XCC2_9CAUD|nr:putative tail-fiber protein [Acinetobacter phage LZ35]AMD43190.1 tail fiber protein [Acinetobacter phage LZ35]
MTNPTLITTPFAENGDKNIIPESVGAEPQNATMQAGFPPITQQKISEGGIPPERNDFNGMFNLVTQHLVHLNNGMSYEFDQEHADKIGGYPLNTRLMLDNGDIVKSTVPNNTINPNSDMTGWVKVNSAGQIIDSSGRTQQEINNTLSFKKTPEFYGANGNGTTVDNAAFSALAAIVPDSIELKAGATYLIDSSSTVNFTGSCLVNGNGATIIMDQRWNIQKTAMWGSQLSSAASKGDTVLNMAFMTNFVVGAKVLIFQNLGLSGAAIDPYFASVQDDADNGEYSSHVNYVTAIDTVNKTITLRNPLEFNAPVQTVVYVTTDKKLVFNNVNFIVQGDSTGFRLIDNCDNILFNNCSFTQKEGQVNNVNLRINTCYNVLFSKCKTNGVNFTIEYGSNSCGVIDSKMASNGEADALLMIWCASTNCYSIRNEFLASQNMKVGSISAGVYFGAKSRNCFSLDDFVHGLPYGFRAQWGAINPQFIRPTYINPNGIYSVFMDYSHNPHLIDAKLYNKPFRTVGVHGLTLKDTLLDSGWRGEAGEIPLMLDLNRGNDTTMVRTDYTITGNTVIGAARSWLALSKSTFTNNNMTSLRFINAGVMKDTYFNCNILGNFYAQNVVNCGFTNNTVDYSYLQSGTIAGADVAGVHLYAQTMVNMSGNTIIHPTCGVKRTTPNSQLNCITESNNNIISTTQWDTGVNDTTAPTISAGAAYLSRGLEYKSNVAGSKVVWRYNGSSWVKGFSEYPQLSYAQGSFNNTPNGLTTFTTTRTIAGAVVGDTVLVSTTSTDIGEVKGKYFARVTAPDTITVYYQDRSGVSETVAALSITLTLVKS